MLALTEEIVRVPTDELRPHPASSDVPKMSGAEWALFLADVGRRGVQEPLVVLAGTDLVLDGRHRLDAAELSEAEDVPVRYVDVPESEQVDYVIRAAICRRHLNESQRALLAAKIATVGRGRQAADLEGANLHVQTVEQAAKLLNVSPRSVKSARSVLASGHEALAQAIAAGDTTVSAAAKLLDLPPAAQRDAVAGGKQGVKAATSRIKPKEKPQPKLDLPALTEAFLGLDRGERQAFFREAFTSVSEEERMSLLDWIDHASFEAVT